jgi:hypothetical protein
VNSADEPMAARPAATSGYGEPERDEYDGVMLTLPFQALYKKQGNPDGSRASAKAMKRNHQEDTSC